MSWSPWSSVSEGHAGPGTTVTAVPIAGDRFALFVADPEGGVFTASGNAGGWSPWSSVSEGHAGPGTSVAAVLVEGNRFVLYAADPAGGVFTASGDSGSPIKHVFVLMLENRSFDHMLGFSGITGTDAETGRPTTIAGLTGGESNDFDGRTFTVATGATDVMDIGPGHEFEDVLEQLTGQVVKEPFPDGAEYPAPIDNSGFVANYAKKVAAEFRHRKARALATGGVSSTLQSSALEALEAQEAQFDLGVVMRCFSPSQLPVLTALAREFVVCDNWFSSIPGPTEPNRMFAHAATAGTWDRSPDHSELLGAQGTEPLHEGFKFKNGTIYDLLRKAGVKYRIYADDSFPVVNELDDVGERRDFSDFSKDLQDPHFDAGYVHIEPAYGVLPFTEGNSQHLNYPGGVAAGERFIKATYEAIRNSPVWKDSLLIITWDEHGGFYDHVTPGLAPRTGNRGRRWGFMFDNFGLRVPAVVVSPLIRGRMIEHRTFDHTAIPATLSRVFKLPLLGARNDVISGLDHLVGNVFRSETPATLPNVATAGELAFASTRPLDEMAARSPAALLSDDPQGSLARVLHSAIVQHLKIAPANQRAAIMDRVRLLTTHADAFIYLKEVEHLVHAERVRAGRHD
jgi:phospholipase C